MALWWLRGSQLKSKERHLTADENHSHVAFVRYDLLRFLLPALSFASFFVSSVHADENYFGYSFGAETLPKGNGNYIVGPRAALARALGLIRLSI